MESIINDNISCKEIIIFVSLKFLVKHLQFSFDKYIPNIVFILIKFYYDKSIDEDHNYSNDGFGKLRSWPSILFHLTVSSIHLYHDFTNPENLNKEQLIFHFFSIVTDLGEIQRRFDNRKIVKKYKKSLSSSSSSSSCDHIEITIN